MLFHRVDALLSFLCYGKLFILASEFDVFIDWEMLILEVKFADFGPLLMDSICLSAG